MENVTAVIRSIGERTEDKCVEYLQNIFGKKNVFHVKNAIPFSKAVRKTFEIGLQKNKKWTLAIDADVFLFPDKVTEFIKVAGEFVNKTKNVYCLEGKLFDKFSQRYREVGCHLYQTTNLKKALEFVDDGVDDVRPETYVKIKMAELGYGFYVSNLQIGIHDFFQYFGSIMKKAILHCKKHDDIDVWIKKWEEQAESDEDFVWALKGRNFYNSLIDKTIKVDAEFMSKLICEVDFPPHQELTDAEIQAMLQKYDMESEHEKFVMIFGVKA